MRDVGLVRKAFAYRKRDLLEILYVKRLPYGRVFPAVDGKEILEYRTVVRRIVLARTGIQPRIEIVARENHDEFLFPAQLFPEVEVERRIEHLGFRPVIAVLLHPGRTLQKLYLRIVMVFIVPQTGIEGRLKDVLVLKLVGVF